MYTGSSHSALSCHGDYADKTDIQTDRQTDRSAMDTVGWSLTAVSTQFMASITMHTTVEYKGPGLRCRQSLGGKGTDSISGFRCDVK